MRRLSRIVEAGFRSEFEEDTWDHAIESIDAARDVLSRAYREEIQKETKARYEAALDAIEKAAAAIRGE